MMLIKRQVESMDKWLILKSSIIEKGYMLWQTQYSWDSPKGYIVGFMKDGIQLEVVTHDKDVAYDIIHSGL